MAILVQCAIDSRLIIVLDWGKNLKVTNKCPTEIEKEFLFSESGKYYIDKVVHGRVKS